jgi:predicted lipid-binding transport protein (Tim44 family)
LTPYIEIIDLSTDGTQSLNGLLLVVFAVIAAVVLFQLYAVLGRRVGRQPEDAEALTPPVPDAGPALEKDTVQGAALTGLAALRQRDPAFDTTKFLAGAKSAYQMIVTAFAERDRETLKDLLAPKVLAGFEKVMVDREAKGEVETVEFLHPPRADVESIDVDADLARIRVRFLAEHRARTKTDEGEAVEDRRTAESWTFERNLNSRSPSWVLARVDAAEA